MAESNGHQSEATTRLIPAGVTAAFTPNEQMSTVTLTSTKKKADPPVPGPFPIIPRQGPPYDYAWYHSPLEEPSIYHMSNPAAAVTAYEATKAVNKRVQFDLRNMKSVLLERGLIENSDSDEYASSWDDAVNVFAGAK